MTFIQRISALAVLLLLAGCQEEEVNTYEVAKEAPKGWPTQNHSRQTPGSQKGEPMGNPAAGTATAPSSAPMMSGTSGGSMQALPGMAEQSAQFGTPTWKAPENWQEQAPGSMRKGSWKIEDDGKMVDVSVLVFPGDVGGDLANVNRWAGQIGATPLTAEQLEAMKAENTLEVDKHPGFLATLTGPTGQSIAGVIVPYHGATWFFKMQGDTELVNAEAVNFGLFMSSVRFPAH